MLAAIPAIQPVSNKTLKRLSSGFGYRIDPIYRTRKMHKGLDFSARKGTEVYATGDGVIKKVKRLRWGYGTHIVIDHGYGYSTLYAHLSAAKVRRGQKVKRGQLIGLVGKYYDMPVAVLSSLTLGMSVDFAIHYIERARQLRYETGSWAEAAKRMSMAPARAISRNGIVIAFGFLPLLAAGLIPYKTVGFFLFTIMAVSGLATLVILPSLITVMQGLLFRKAKPRNA